MKGHERLAQRVEVIDPVSMHMRSPFADHVRVYVARGLFAEDAPERLSHGLSKRF